MTTHLLVVVRVVLDGRPFEAQLTGLRLAKERSPELASLNVLESGLATCGVTLYAAHNEVADGALDDCERGSFAVRVRAILVAVRRLTTALATYHEALVREGRTLVRERVRVRGISF